MFNMLKFSLWLTVLVLWILLAAVDSIQHCKNRKPAIRMCTVSPVVTTSTAFLETGSVPELQQNECLCTITPLGPEIHALLTFRQEPKRISELDMRIRLGNTVLDKYHSKGNTTLVGETKLQLTTGTNQRRNNGVCVLIDSADFSKFNISCEGEVPYTKEETTVAKTAINITMETNSADSVEDNDDPNKLVGPIAGGAVTGAVILFFLIFLLIVCRKSKTEEEDDTTTKTRRKADKPMVQTNADDTSDEDDDDYSMTENPLYDMFEDRLKNEQAVDSRELRLKNGSAAEYGVGGGAAEDDKAGGASGGDAVGRLDGDVDVCGNDEHVAFEQYDYIHDEKLPHVPRL